MRPTIAHTTVVFGPVAGPTAISVLPVPTASGVVAWVHVTPSAERHSAALLPAGHVTGSGSSPVNTVGCLAVGLQAVTPAATQAPPPVLTTLHSDSMSNPAEPFGKSMR